MPYSSRNQRIASGFSGSPAEQTRRKRWGYFSPAPVDGHHGPHRRRRREHVRDLVAAEEVELLVRVEPALALIDALNGAQSPRAQQRRDARRPCPLAHAVEALSVLDLVAVGELLVRQEVAVGMDDALRHAGRSRRVVELRGVVGRGIGSLEARRMRRPEDRSRGSASRRPTPRSGRRCPSRSRAPAARSPRAGA